MIFYNEDPLDRRFLELYETTPAKGYRRAELLRRLVLGGLLLSYTLDRTDILKQISARLGISSAELEALGLSDTAVSGE